MDWKALMPVVTQIEGLTTKLNVVIFRLAQNSLR